MELVCIGVSHRAASVEVREKLALAPEVQQQLLEKLAVHGEVMLVSTCNRVELYSATETPDELRAAALAAFEQAGGAAMAERMIEHRGDDAALHLFRVASSLDSMVLGEPQILGQVKDAYELAKKLGTARGEIDRTCAAAFVCAKRVRTDTAIGRAPVSMASAAVQLAKKVFGELSSCSVLVVGAGEMSALVARHLASAGAKQLVVTNRTLARAEALAAEVGGVAKPFEELTSLVTAADVLMTCTAAQTPIFTRESIAPAVKKRRHRPLFIVDLAVPRDVDPGVSGLDGVYAYNVDDIQTAFAENLGQRASEAAKAEEIVSQEIVRFVRARAERQHVEVIKRLRAHAEEIVRAELEHSLPRLGALNEKQVAQVQTMAMAIVNRMLHAPTVRLRAAGGAPQGEHLASAAAQLFGFEPIAGDVVVPTSRRTKQ